VSLIEAKNTIDALRGELEDMERVRDRTAEALNFVMRKQSLINRIIAIDKAYELHHVELAMAHAGVG